ncbi:endoplasmic reticulum lectin 1 isoform X2 [Epargyreus clarus]|uniref:endoplasmic reticulum lectin 1 isoform X2 n=1 Tax=Epargyreus clarus TaxID=520877 RepID=UPI003C2BBEFF
MKAVWLILCVVGVVQCFEGLGSINHDFRGFDDNILFSIKWPGQLDTPEIVGDGENNKSENKETIKVLTHHKEKYECQLPELYSKESSGIEEYDGPSPIRLLQPLFSQKICSYRLESYWSYEVCHGRYVRQYHEERDDKKVTTQEFFLGHWKTEKMAQLEADMKTAEEMKEPLKTTKMEGLSLPFVEMVMDDGTVCDLSGKPRLTRVRYVCDVHGKHEVYSFKETATCEYEIIILSPFLCEHPRFKPKEVSENVITCLPLDGAPAKPRSLLKDEIDNVKKQFHSIKLSEGGLNFELHPLTEMSELTSEAGKGTAVSKPMSVILDDSPVRAFLNGENCLHGGTGWWKYEFCYGKHVRQYHVDRSGAKQSLLLGEFDERAHLQWIRENRGKAPKPVEQRTSVSHFYANGEICDKTGKPRQTEVKLKCLENSSSPAQVSLYLLEPRTCYYILGVESPLICDILPLADENGLIKATKLPKSLSDLPTDSAKEEKADSEQTLIDIEKTDVE